MKPGVLKSAFIFGICVISFAHGATKQESFTFELSPGAPPEPAMKYQLLFEDAFDRRPGNAAIFYFDAILLTSPEEITIADKAIDAYAAGNMTRFNSLADSIEATGMVQELDLAGKRQECDWQTPTPELGIKTLLPHLNSVRGIANILKVHTFREMNQGKIDDALKTLRLGYEMAENIAKEPIIVSGLVSLSITGMMNDCLRQLMNLPDAPNLYWALSGFPSHLFIFRASTDVERTMWFATLPELTKLKSGNELSTDEWHAVFQHIADLRAWERQAASHARTPDPLQDTGAELLQQARNQYSQKHHLTPEQANSIDPAVAIGSFYFSQYEIVCDDMYKLRGLPYSILLTKTAEFDDRMANLEGQEPANIFLPSIPRIHKLAMTLARVDRELAALTVVEAIRAYAAANNGQFPARLEDIKDTPAMDNPATGLPFNYSMDNGVVTISDSQSEEPLTYTIKLRK